MAHGETMPVNQARNDYYFNFIPKHTTSINQKE